MSNFSNPEDQQERPLPKRIILIRHGESQGNIDETMYGITSDHKIPLTPIGMEQAKQAGKQIMAVVSVSDSDQGTTESNGWNVYFYVSPYTRTRATLKGIGESFPKNRVIGVKEECRVREQDFGNFQDYEEMKKLKETRKKYGKFFYRFPQGESGADVYDRVSSFLESLWRDIDMNRFCHQHRRSDLNLVIISHGLSIRVFLMRWFKWTVEQFELLKSPKNCEYRVMQLGHGGEYSLAIHHNEDMLQAWGLSPEMVADQKWRAYGPVCNLNAKKIWYCDAFFDHLADPEENAEEDTT